MGDLEGRVAVVTGGARGIGRTVAETFLRAGATVVIGDIRDELAARTAAQLSDAGSVAAAHLDVRDWDEVGAFFAAVAREHSRLDVLVNCAGIQAIAPSLEMTRDAWRDVIDVNLGGTFACAQAAGRAMAEQRSGSIVNLASAAANLALPGRAPYCSAKGGVVSLTRVLGIEWASLGIRVNAIGPGWVKTDLVAAAIEAGQLSEEDIARRTPLRRLATTIEIADVAHFLASDRSSYITGQTIYPDGGFTSYGGWT